MMRGRLALSLVSLLLLPASAQVENTFAFTTLSCQRPPQGSPNHQVYASTTADRRCACIVPAEAASMSVYVRCPGPSNGDDYGVAACDEDTGKCAFSCNTDAELRGTECRKMNIAPGIETKVVPLSDCQQSDPLTGGPSAMPFLVAQQRGCNCLWTPNADPAGTPCTGPTDSDVICTTDVLNFAPGVCSFKCRDANKEPQGNACVPKSISPPGGTTPPTDFPREADACIYDDQTLFAYTDNICGCYDIPAQAASDGSSATACTGPDSGPGTGACRDTSATSSECFIKCKDGYRIDGRNCVLARTDLTVNENCPRRPPGQFFTAVIGEGCVCKPTRTDQWCRRPTGGTSTCFQSADLKVVECRPVCPTKQRLDATTNRCVPACPDGEKPEGSGCVPVCASTERWENGHCVLNCADGKVEFEGACIQEFETTLAPCPAGRTLAAADNGCNCVPNARVNLVQRCNNPTTAGTGVAKCVMRYDGTEPHCGVECNAPLRPNTANNDCVA